MDILKVNVLVFNGSIKLTHEPEYYIEREDRCMLELIVDDQMLDDDEFLASYIRLESFEILEKQKVNPNDYFMEIEFVKHHAGLGNTTKTLIRVDLKKK